MTRPLWEMSSDDGTIENLDLASAAFAEGQAELGKDGRGASDPQGLYGKDGLGDNGKDETDDREDGGRESGSKGTYLGL